MTQGRCTLMRSLPLAQSKDYHISAATLWLWAVAVFWLMLATFGIGAATGARAPLSLMRILHTNYRPAPHIIGVCTRCKTKAADGTRYLCLANGQRIHTCVPAVRMDE